MIDGKKTVYVVSVHTRGERETTITVFDNEDAALKYAASAYDKSLFEYLVQIDEAPVYTKFMEKDNTTMWAKTEAEFREWLNADAEFGISKEDVVRCKDCKYRMTSQYTDKDCVCDYTQLDMYDDDYCSYGERRDEGE